MNSIIIFTIFWAVISAKTTATTYEGYKVYEVTPKTIEQTQILKDFEKNEQFDFWSPLRGLNQSLQIMVPPNYQKIFENILRFQDIKTSLLIDDVQEVFRQEKLRNLLSPRTNLGDISFTKYHRYNEIQAYLRKLARSRSSIVTLSSIGKSSEGRDISMIKISTGGNRKPTILIDAGIHAREWIAPSMALYIIQELTENPKNIYLIENIDWMIIPVLNPDGYEYSHTNTRLWRKTRSKGKACHGVDGNRNFGFHWMEGGADDAECSIIYGGPKAFSEPETRALRDLVLANEGKIKLYLTFHSYGKFLLYPWGYTSDLPADWKELHLLASDANYAISSLRGTRYTVGSSTNVLYVAAGGSDDWCKGVGGVNLSYTIELPGGGRFGFDLPTDQISGVVQETWLGVKVFSDYIKYKFVRP